MLPLAAQESLDLLLKITNTNSIPYISVEELKRLQSHDAPLIFDAREKEEYEVSHIESAVYVGYSEFSSEKISEKIKDKDRPVVVYCSLGIRSEKIGEKLKKAGFTNVRNLYGGIFEWKNKGYPIVDETNSETENIHAFSPFWSKWLLKGNKVY
jgi:rhodanese-related sulfurtransferase